MTGTLEIESGVVLLDRRKRGRFVEVTVVTDSYVHGIRIDEGGHVKGGRRPPPVRKADVGKRFHVYRPCRWSLHCLTQATVVIGHSSGDIDACAEHAREYREWLESIKGVIHANWREEPEPECWCPDDVVTGGRLPVRYCPKDGTPQRRGTELGELAPVSGGAGLLIEGPDRGKCPQEALDYFDET